MYPAIAEYLAARGNEFEQIDAQRRALLERLSEHIRRQRDAGAPIRLTFICTHNSRRSQMAQLWAAAAAETCGLRVSTYSGGTEATAFNPRAVAAMQRAGFRIEKTSDDPNPFYHVRCSERLSAMTCFSKRFDAAPNPTQDFAAIMVCDDADHSCPSVPGASARFAIPYVDPKRSDGSASESAVYDERCAQIAREMLYVMRRVDALGTPPRPAK